VLLELRNPIVLQNKHILFHKQLQDTTRKYPNLKIINEENGISYIKGILDIPNDLHEIVGHFLVEVRCSNKFPFRFPILFEIGGEIPNSADSHKNPDTSCCITVLSDEILICKNGIGVSLFIAKYAIPYFANYIYKKQTGDYKNGEYAHGIKGISQFYESLMKTDNRHLWIQYFNNTFRNLKVECGRNDLCFCGSGYRFKKCHLEVFINLYKIGELQICHDFNLIFT
jgi:hypothetical protein